MPVELLELVDEVLDVAKLAIVADSGAFVAVACGWHAVAGSHETGLQTGRKADGWLVTIDAINRYLTAI